MRIIIQSDVGATLDIMHVADESLDDCMTMAALESRMLDARYGLRACEAAISPQPAPQVEVDLEPALDPAKPCEICSAPTRDGALCDECHDSCEDIRLSELAGKLEARGEMEGSNILDTSEGGGL